VEVGAVGPGAFAHPLRLEFVEPDEWVLEPGLVRGLSAVELLKRGVLVICQEISVHDRGHRRHRHPGVVGVVGLLKAPARGEGPGEESHGDARDVCPRDRPDDRGGP